MPGLSSTLPYGFKPNIIVFNLDDAPLDFATVGLRTTVGVNYLGGWNAFDRTNCTVSLCAPDRVTCFTGVMPQIHNMTGNQANEGGGVIEPRLFYFTALSAIGYINGLYGKWVNGAGESGTGGAFDLPLTPRQPGVHNQYIMSGAPSYDDWYGNDGVNALVHHVGTDTANWSDDVMGTKMTTFIDSCVANNPGVPFSIYCGFKSSHVSYTPPDRYAATSISFTNNDAFGVDPSIVGAAGYAQPQWMIDDADSNWQQSDIDAFNADHLEKHRCHYGADDSIKAVIDKLVTYNLLDKTLIIVKTDNAANMGEFRQQSAKGSMLKSAQDCVMYVRAPVASGSPNYTITNQSVSDMDVAATIYHVSGAKSRYTLNGQSFQPLLNNASQTHREVAPYTNLWKDSPCGIGGVTASGVVAGYTPAKSLETGDATNTPGERYSWADTYCLTNLGGNDSVTGMVDRQLQAISTWWDSYVCHLSANGDYLSTPSAAANQITSNISIVSDVALIDWSPSAVNTLIGKDDLANQRSYNFYVNTDGTLGFKFSTDGTAVTTVTSTAAVNFESVERRKVAVERNATTGDVRFYTSLDAQTWTQLGSTVAAASGAIFSGTAIVQFGKRTSPAYTLNAKVFGNRIYTGFICSVPSGAVLKVNFDPALCLAGASTFVSSTGETWTVNGDANIFAKI